MSISTIRAGIVSKLNEISLISKVLDYVVWTDDWEVIYNKFTDGNRVNVWMVGLGNSASNVVMGQGYRQRPYSFNLVGYYSQKMVDESSKSFEDIIGEILDKFDSTYSVSTGAELEVPANLLSINSTLFAQHPCHTAVIQIGIRDREAFEESTMCE